MTENAPNTDPAVELRGVSKDYGPTRALREIRLALPWGRVLALFGHNGAGKSTLLRILATLAKPSDGGVRVAGFDARSQAGAVRASVGYAGHHDLLYDDLTPAENLRFYARLYGVPNPAGRVEQVLTDLAAGGWAHRRVRVLSNGMRKRVSIARAILHQPPVLLLDEPDAGLDIEAQQLVDAVVRAVAQAGGSVVLASHDPSRGLAVADDYAVLRAGRLAAQGDVASTTPDDIAALLTSPSPGETPEGRPTSPPPGDTPEGRPNSPPPGDTPEGRPNSPPQTGEMPEGRPNSPPQTGEMPEGQRGKA